MSQPADLRAPDDVDTFQIWFIWWGLGSLPSSPGSTSRTIGAGTRAVKIVNQPPDARILKDFSLRLPACARLALAPTRAPFGRRNQPPQSVRHSGPRGHGTWQYEQARSACSASRVAELCDHRRHRAEICRLFKDWSALAASPLEAATLTSCDAAWVVRRLLRLEQRAWYPRRTMRRSWLGCTSSVGIGSEDGPRI